MKRWSQCYCAFCKSGRKVYARKHVGVVHVLSAFLISGSLTLAFWQNPDPRGLVIFSLILGIFELFVQFRWRLSVICPICHFDPVLYLKNCPAAVEKVRLRIEEHIKDPLLLRVKSPEFAQKIFTPTHRKITLKREVAERLTSGAMMKVDNVSTKVKPLDQTQSAPRANMSSAPALASASKIPLTTSSITKPKSQSNLVPNTLVNTASKTPNLGAKTT